MKITLKNSILLGCSAIAMYSVVSVISSVSAAPYTSCGYGYSDAGVYGYGYGVCTPTLPVPTTSSSSTSTSGGGSSSSSSSSSGGGSSSSSTGGGSSSSAGTTSAGTTNSCGADVPAHVAMRTPKLKAVGSTVYGKFSGKYVKYNKSLKGVFASLMAMSATDRNARIDVILAKILCIKPSLTGDARVLVQFIEDNLVMMK